MDAPVNNMPPVSGRSVSDVLTPLLASWGQTEAEVGMAILEYRKRHDEAVVAGRGCGAHPYDLCHPWNNYSPSFIKAAMESPPERVEVRDRHGRITEIIHTRRMGPFEKNPSFVTRDGRFWRQWTEKPKGLKNDP